MPKGKPKYRGEFKQMVVETMRKEKLSYLETEQRFKIGGHCSVQRWERIYREEGPEGLYVDRRGRSGKRRRPPKQLKPEVDLSGRRSGRLVC